MTTDVADTKHQNDLPKGVFRTSWGNRYFSQIRVGNGKRIYLGTYETPEGAEAAYQSACRELQRA